jgi:peptide deformylase
MTETRPIRILGDPVLRRKAEAVDDKWDTVEKLVAEMLRAMRSAKGIGLAAPQIGESLRVVVVDLSSADPEAKPLALVNPSILSRKGEQTEEEGCLSIPGIWEVVRRPSRLVLEAQLVTGEPATIEADGTLARVLDHELDHLDGVLFIDRLSPLKRKLLSKKLPSSTQQRPH